MSRGKHIIGYGATAAVALGIGIGAGSSSGSPTAAAASTPAPTVTVTGEAPPADAVTRTVTAPPVTRKVTAPPVTKTITAPPVTKKVTVTVKAKPKGPSATIPGDGTFAVGTDIQPGTYVSSAAPGGIGECYWARLRDMNDGINSIIANNLSAGQSIVTISSSDRFFQSTGCNTWKRR